MTTLIPMPPEENQDPWFDTRDAFDNAVRTRLNDELSDAILLETIASNTLTVSMESFGVVGDGITDDTESLQAAADAAKEKGATLVGGGDVRISGPVTISSSVALTGQILINSSTGARLSFTRQSPAQSIDKSGVTGLTQGSIRVTGLPGAGTLAIVSSELLINRFPEGQGTYTKNETVRVLQDGTITPPLEHTYDMSKVTALRYWPEEPEVSISGVRVVIDGTAEGTDFITMSLTGATVTDCSVVNSSSSNQYLGIRVLESGDIRFNRLISSGFLTPGGGYGVLLDRTFNIYFNDCLMGLSRHAIAGRHTNGVQVTGGTIYGGFDTHWGGRISLSGVTSYIPSTHIALDHVLISGQGDVTVTGGEFIGGRAVVGLRGDTPTQSGTVSIEDCTFLPATTLTNTSYLDRSVYFGGSVVDAWSSFNFANPMKCPNVVIRNVKVISGATNPIRGCQVPPTQFPRGPYGFDVERLTVRGGASLEVVLHGDNTVSPSSTVVTRVRQIDWDNTTLTAGVTFRGSSGTASSFRADVRITDVQSRVGLTWEKDVRCDWTIRDSLVGIINSVNAPTVVTNNRAEVLGCTMNGAWFGSQWTADFVDSVWAGNTGSGSTPTPINDRCRWFSGRRAIGAVGAPTHPNGYSNPTYYT